MYTDKEDFDENFNYYDFIENAKRIAKEDMGATEPEIIQCLKQFSKEYDPFFYSSYEKKLRLLTEKQNKIKSEYDMLEKQKNQIIKFVAKREIQLNLLNDYINILNHYSSFEAIDFLATCLNNLIAEEESLNKKIQTKEITTPQITIINSPVFGKISFNRLQEIKIKKQFIYGNEKFHLKGMSKEKAIKIQKYTENEIATNEKLFKELENKQKLLNKQYDNLTNYKETSDEKKERINYEKNINLFKEKIESDLVKKIEVFLKNTESNFKNQLIKYLQIGQIAEKNINNKAVGLVSPETIIQVLKLIIDKRFNFEINNEMQK